MDILKFPHPALFKECKEVSVFSPELKVLLEAMWETMIRSHGLGLAANQVGLEFKMFTMHGPNEEKLFIINPKVIRKSLKSANIREGCLSAPGEFIVIGNRADWIQIEFQDETGSVHKRIFNDLYAICVQHEMEHLMGKSFLQSKTIPKDKRYELKKKWGVK
jgi:peptide deformylase